ncbi:MAG: peptidyl-alpha-hydroxyglycine alpha-amidating lyase family protein [Balneolales bacterium]
MDSIKNNTWVILTLLLAILGYAGSQYNITLEEGNLFNEHEMKTDIISATPYRSVGTWGNLPDGRTWGAVIGVNTDSDGNLWVLERCGSNTCLGSDLDPILKFNEEGDLIESFGRGMLAWPHGFYIDEDDNIWVTDAAGLWLPDAQPFLDQKIKKGHTVIKFNPEGEVLLTLGEPGIPGNDSRHFNLPSDVVIGDNGDIFVADGHQLRGNSRIVKFSSDGTFIKEWGKLGMEPEEFRDPHALAIDSQGRLFVGDRMNNRIQIFTQDGEFLEIWTQFSRPSGIFIDDKDNIYVADSESNYARNPGWERGIRIGNTKDGWVRNFIPDPEPFPDEAGTSGAEYIGVDKMGNIYAAEVGPRNLNKYILLRPNSN